MVQSLVSRGSENRTLESPTFHRGRQRFSRLVDAVEGSPRILDPRILAARILLLSPHDPRRSLYKDIDIDHPCVFFADRWLSLGKPPLPVASESEAVSALLRSLRAAVERLLEGCRCVAVLTGGGLDSSLLLALACDWAKRTGHRAFGVALDFEGEGDDRPFLAELEGYLGCEIVRCLPEGGANRFDLFLQGVDAAPFTWCGGPMEVEAFARACDGGADVVLTGNGGDELFDGHPGSLADRVSSSGWLAAIHDAIDVEGFSRPRFPAFEWILRPHLSRVVPTSLRRLRGARRRCPPTWSGPVLQEFHQVWFAGRIEDAFIDRSDIYGRRRLFLGSPHREHLLWLRHQEEVASGAVIRGPYLDPILIQEVLRFPPDWLLRGNVRRGLFREASKGLIPENLRRRMSKAAFEPAFLRLFRAADGFRKLREYADARELSSLGIVSKDVFRTEADAFLSNPEVGGYGWTTVLPVLATEAFLRTHRARLS